MTAPRTWFLSSLATAGLAVATAFGQNDPIPGPDAPAAGTKPPAPANRPGDTVQLHRVIYVHQGDGRNLLEEKKFVDPYSAPPQLFHNNEPTLPQFIAPDIVLSRQQMARQRHAAENQKNWMLLTPEEILGVETKKKDGNDPNEYLTPDQRFIRRQELLRSGTNSLTGPSLFDNKKEKDRFTQDNPFSSPDRSTPGRNNESDSRWNRNSLTELMSHDRPEGIGAGASADTSSDSPWRNTVWGTAPAEDHVQAELKRKTEMAQFVHMLNPDAAPDATTKPPKSETSGPVTAGNSGFNPLTGQATPVVTAAGSFAHMKESIGHAAPLPTLVTERPQTIVDTRRKPSPPPWTLKPGQWTP